MIKKILYYSLIMIGFIFAFINADKINILAMGSFYNSIGTMPIQMDIENYNYNSTNLFNINALPATFGDDNTAFVDYETQTITIDNNYYNYSFRTLKQLAPSLVVGETYILSATTTGPGIIYLRGASDNVWSMNDTRVLTQNDLDSVVVFYGNYDSGIVKINNIRINKGDVVLPYEPFFQFGYLADLSYVINVDSNTTVNYYFNEYTYTKTSSSVDSGYLLENYYLPFIIDSRGYVSLPNINFGISSISNNYNDYSYTLLLELTPVFDVYYKNQYTKNIYTKLNYMSNDLFFSGITFGGCKNNSCSNTINTSNLNLNNSRTLAITEQNDTGSISTTNISTYYNDDIKNRNYFEYNNYLNIIFRMGDISMNYNYMNGRNYTFAISSLSSRIIDNQTTTTPLPDNDLTRNKYNTCSAWYDIPCQLGNAVTYVIYEAPVISPILSFINVFITMFSSLVSFVDLFKSFGILFGCFVIYMFIELLHKFSK